jgi:hypothetical protein
MSNEIFEKSIIALKHIQYIAVNEITSRIVYTFCYER